MSDLKENYVIINLPPFDDVGAQKHETLMKISGWWLNKTHSHSSNNFVISVEDNSEDVFTSEVVLALLPQEIRREGQAIAYDDELEFDIPRTTTYFYF